MATVKLLWSRTQSTVWRYACAGQRIPTVEAEGFIYGGGDKLGGGLEVTEGELFKLRVAERLGFELADRVRVVKELWVLDWLCVIVGLELSLREKVGVELQLAMGDKDDVGVGVEDVDKLLEGVTDGEMATHEPLEQKVVVVSQQIHVYIMNPWQQQTLVPLQLEPSEQVAAKVIVNNKLKNKPK